VIRHGELADVVEQRSDLDPLDVMRRHPELARETARIHLNAPDVIRGGLILGVDRECERLDRGKVRGGVLIGSPREAARDVDGEQRTGQKPERRVGQ
jgi:hypothetical protein